MLATDRPLDVPGLHRRIRAMLADAERFIGGIPSDAVGFVFLEGGKPVQPALEALGKYRRRAGAQGGVWPSSAEAQQSGLRGRRRLRACPTGLPVCLPVQEAVGEKLLADVGPEFR